MNVKRQSYTQNIWLNKTMTMPSAPLVLSTLQQHWLLEMQVAAPFLAPYRKAERSVPTKGAVKPVAQQGVAAVPKAPGQTLKAGLSRITNPVPVETAAPKPAAKPISVPLEQMDLGQLAAFSQQCEQCDLHTQRVQAVFGAGQTQQPDWFVVSSAPSSNEELAGLPMQGKSGELFAAQMQSIGVDVQQQLYITQLLKCRSDAKTQSDYIQACQSLLWRQIALIKPRRLLLLGSKAVTLFLGDESSFETQRGRVHQWQDPSSGRQLPVVVSYHPSSILLRPQLKAQSWSDLILCRQLQDE